MGQSSRLSQGTMNKQLALIIALVAAVAADGLHGHGSSHATRRTGRRSQGVRRGGGVRRSGRQEALGGYEAPAASEDVPVYTGDDVGALDEAASDVPSALDMLQTSIPGVPGEDYPIYAEVPETAFTCDGQVDGGYYADPEAECQVFHICTADGAGGLAKYSFLCPNGTLFNQNYFVCDWWFNFDCSTAEELYSLNDEIAAEREAIDSAAGAASDSINSYDAPPAEYSGAVEDIPSDYAVGRRGRRLQG